MNNCEISSRNIKVITKKSRLKLKFGINYFGAPKYMKLEFISNGKIYFCKIKKSVPRIIPIFLRHRLLYEDLIMETQRKLVAFEDVIDGE